MAHSVRLWLGKTGGSLPGSNPGWIGYLYLYVTWQYALLCYRATGAIAQFLGSRRIETVPTYIEVLLRPTLVQSDEPSDLRGSPSLTTRHR